MELFVRKNKDDKISKGFYYLGRMTVTGKAEEKQYQQLTETGGIQDATKNRVISNKCFSLGF